MTSSSTWPSTEARFSTSSLSARLGTQTLGRQSSSAFGLQRLDTKLQARRRAQTMQHVGRGCSATSNTTNIMGTRVRHPEKPLATNPPPKGRRQPALRLESSRNTSLGLACSDTCWRRTLECDVTPLGVQPGYTFLGWAYIQLSHSGGRFLVVR